MGPASVGKTRLVDELTARGPASNVAIGGAVDYGMTPYTPLLELWRQLDAREPTVLAKRPDLLDVLAGFAVRPPDEDEGEGTMEPAPLGRQHALVDG